MAHENRRAALIKKHKLKGVNKPKRTPSHKPKTAKDKARKKSFKARHAKNISKGKMSAAYWANKEKW